VITRQQRRAAERRGDTPEFKMVQPRALHRVMCGWRDCRATCDDMSSKPLGWVNLANLHRQDRPRLPADHAWALGP
jgi:hypothetical protein